MQGWHVSHKERLGRRIRTRDRRVRNLGLAPDGTERRQASVERRQGDRRR
jgi:hypothetical protein